MADTASPTLTDLGRPQDGLADELAWCLSRFVDASADEQTMRRAQLALRAWRAASDGRHSDA